MIYRLTITVAGPGFNEIVKIEDQDRSALVPIFTETQGLIFERYGTETDYLEIRFDYIVARELASVEIKTEPDPEPFEDPERTSIFPQEGDTDVQPDRD